jgi:ribosomal protein S18 acetylase RimI-like enzyme
VVRPAKAADAEAIARVQVETWRAAYAHAVPAETLARASVDERVRLWEGWLARPGAVATFVAQTDGEVVGFASVGPAADDPGLGELYSIYVLPRAWGTGAAAALIDRGEEALRQGGFTAAVLNVLADNPRARRFYERQGWARGETLRSTFLGHEVELARHRKEL